MKETHQSYRPERGYFYQRAEEELQQAEHAGHPAAMKAHYILAGLYLDQVYNTAEEPHMEVERRREPG
jgi:hypothetical protein